MASSLKIKRMSLCYLGHAGFLAETPEAIVVMDPWLSPTGAFDSAWFQFPRNHHLAGYVQEKLKDSSKQRYIYLSHEHQDHFDPGFLSSLQSRDFCFVLPKFRRSALRDALSSFKCKSTILCEDRQEVPIPGGYLKLYLHDTELNRDSAILMHSRGQSFLNLNDCKLFDALPGIAQSLAPIDVFTCQFSGATWHPTCYDYPREAYERIALKKQLGKFESVAQAVRTLRPRLYLPSAGPPCFLDPMLLHLNFEPVNIFPHAPKILDYLSKRVPECRTLEIMPGDVINVDTGNLEFAAAERVTTESYKQSIEQYAAEYDEYFVKRKARNQVADPYDVRERVADVFRTKLDKLTLADRITRPLYFMLSELGQCTLRVDFPARKVEQACGMRNESHYSVTAPAWQIARVLDGDITWEEFALTFRMRLNRAPDVYQTLIQGFLILEPEDMNYFCAKLLNIESRSERIAVEAAGKRFVCDRYCPHSGADLKHAWVENERYLTCPRHRWQFDLPTEGRCVGNSSTIHAVSMEDD